MKISIIVPVYNEEFNLKNFLMHISKIISAITEYWEIIFILDPCPDRSEEIINNFCNNDSRIKLIKLSRRFGQPAATWAGLTYASGDVVIPIDCDLQDPPELIPEMLELWKQGYKVVIPQRKKRSGENIIKKSVACVGYWFINKTSEVNIPKNTGDFRLLDRRVVDELLKLKEAHGFLRGLTSVVGFKTTLVPFERPARFAGISNYNSFTGSIKIGFNGIISFSGTLLRLLAIFGIGMAVISILCAIILALLKLAHIWDFAVGVTTISVLLLFFTGCQFIALGILGAYIGRIYDEVKERPMFIVDYCIGLKK